jgi:hypothetical protein
VINKVDATRKKASFVLDTSAIDKIGVQNYETALNQPHSESYEIRKVGLV